MYLAHVLNSLPGVTARHEPEPNFNRYQGGTLEQRKEWLVKSKLPEIEKSSDAIYIETSNLFNQGFVEPVIELGIPFDVIHLTRDAQSVALSFWRRGIIPGRTNVAIKYHMRPDRADNVLRAKSWEHWTDYTCCLWLAMEKLARSEKYANMVCEYGGQVAHIETGDLISEAGFRNLCHELNLPEPGLDYDKVKNVRFNNTPDGLGNSWPPEGFGNQEQRILESL